MAKKKVIIKCELVFEFESYNSESKDDRVAQGIKKWVRASLSPDYEIPLYILRDKSGAAIEDLAKRIKFVVEIKGKK